MKLRNLVFFFVAILVASTLHAEDITHRLLTLNFCVQVDGLNCERAFNTVLTIANRSESEVGVHCASPQCSLIKSLAPFKKLSVTKISSFGVDSGVVEITADSRLDIYTQIYNPDGLLLGNFYSLGEPATSNRYMLDLVDNDTFDAYVLVHVPDFCAFFLGFYDNWDLVSIQGEFLFDGGFEIFPVTEGANTAAIGPVPGCTGFDAFGVLTHLPEGALFTIPALPLKE